MESLSLSLDLHLFKCSMQAEMLEDGLTELALEPICEGGAEGS